MSETENTPRPPVAPGRAPERPSDGDAFVPLVASAPLRSDAERVVGLLRDGRLQWLRGARHRPTAAGLRRYEVDLGLRVGTKGSGLTALRKAAFLDLGPPARTARGWSLQISWRAAGAAPLFPVFAGHLIVGRDELRIDGLYAPPGGVMGRAADRVLLHLAAHATARWLLEEIDRAGLGASS